MEVKSKSMWRIIKSESGKRTTAKQLSSTLKNNNIHLDYAEEALNNYFLNLINSLKTENMDVDSAMLCLKNSFLEGFPVVLTIPTTGAELINIITSLNSKNSFGFGGLSNQIINLCIQQISKSLTYIFHKSLSQGIFPDLLKYVIVKPLFKRGNRALLANYDLTGFSKLFETLKFRMLNQHFQADQILVPQQYGFQWDYQQIHLSCLVLSSMHRIRKYMYLVCLAT